MIKSLLNKRRDHQQCSMHTAAAAEVSSTHTQQTTASSSDASASTSTSTTTTVSAMRKGRKRFSSMVSRLRKSGRQLRGSMSRKAKLARNGLEDNNEDEGIAITKGKPAAGKLSAVRGSRLPYEFASDDDDDAYKSAEEGTMNGEEDFDQGMEGEDEMRIKSESSSSSSNKRPQSCERDANKETNRTKQSSYVAHSTLTVSDKFVLPEEQCDIPTFLHTQCCDRALIDETRRLLKERYSKNPDNFYDRDYKRMLNEDWTVTRFLLRRRLDPKRTAKLMEECGRFRKQYKMSEVQLWEFPIEFHIAGGLFKYAPDRVGNITMYMRVKMYRRVPEISDVFKAFILCVLEQCDVANNGRGTAVVFDLSGCGLQNVDLGFLSWLLSSFRNYCPKGVSYILVYNLPWILNATCKLAMTWMSASNRRSLRFAYGDEIENYIARENLPDYCGGTCKLDYHRIPEGSRPAVEVCEQLDITKGQALKIRELFKEYLTDDYDKISEKTSVTQRQIDARSHYDDAKSTILETSSSNQSQQHNGLANVEAPGSTTNGGGGLVAEQQQQAANENQTSPVVDLVSQASRFISQ